MEHPLTGKVVIITGASSGIGAATARTLAGLGCKLTLAARSADKLRTLATEIGANAVDVPTDLSIASDITNMVSRTIGQFGRVDVLFANAGTYSTGQIVDGNPDTWANLIGINVTGVLRCVHSVLPYMVAQQSGDILVTSSIAGVTEMRNEPVYSASKHALQTFIHTFRRQVASQGIRVGCIAP